MSPRQCQHATIRPLFVDLLDCVWAGHIKDEVGLFVLTAYFLDRLLSERFSISSTKLAAPFSRKPVRVSR
jgi:hypothetical protein